MAEASPLEALVAEVLVPPTTAMAVEVVVIRVALAAAGTTLR